MNKQTKKTVVAVMSAAKLGAIVQGVISAMGEARESLRAAYSKARAAIVEGIPSGLGQHGAAYKELHRRADYYAEKVFASGQSDAASAKVIKDYLIKQLKADGYVPPLRELSGDEKEQAKREQDAKRKAKARAVAKAKQELRKAEPARKWKEGELEELAAVKVADAVAEDSDTRKQQAAVTAIKEGRASINVLKFPDDIRAGKYSDGTMPRTQAAFAAFLATFWEEAAE